MGRVTAAAAGGSPVSTATPSNGTDASTRSLARPMLRQNSRPPAHVVRAVQPFLNETPSLGCVGWTRSILLIPLAIVRILLFVIFATTTILYLNIVQLFCGRCLRRRTDTEAARCLCLLAPVRWVCRVGLFLFGFFWISETYPPGTPWRYRLGFCCCSPGYLRRRDVPSVIVGNHTSFFDARECALALTAACACPW